MIIDCISDLHGFYPKLEGGDLLIVAGDLTGRDTPEDYSTFGNWVCLQKYRKKVYIAGNHDNHLEKYNKVVTDIFGCEYLCDSGTEFEGLKIWGSPWVKNFEGMNTHCKAFTVETDEDLAEKWALIPDDVDILITHCSPYDHLDHIKTEWNDREPVGSQSLYWAITERIVPRIHVFGHVHEGYGTEERKDYYPPESGNFRTIKYINASHVNERYEPVNKPIRIEL